MLLITDNYMLPCLNKKLFGFECMGCGGQRAFYLFIQGEFVEAFKTYPAIFFLMPLFVVIIISIFYKFKYYNKIISVLAILSIVTLLISYIYKLLTNL